MPETRIIPGIPSTTIGNYDPLLYWERHFCDNIKMGPGRAVGHPFTLGCVPVCMYMCMLAIEWVLATIDNCIHVLRSTTLKSRWRGSTSLA